MKKELYLKIQDYLKSSGIEKLLEKCGAVIVGFSGGADSVFLLSFLKEFLPENKHLCAVHLNHMLRGEEAFRDESFCLDFCRAKRIDFISEKADVYLISQKEKKGIEECAREQRYNLFDKCIKQIVSEREISEEQILVATAHNADDNMETVIFNAARGSAASGLCGIPPIRDGKYIRPILCLSSLEIRDYLKENNVDFVFDSTNAENNYTRNKIRHTVVPLLREINPSVEKAFTRLSESVRRDEEYFEREVLELLNIDRKKGTVPVTKIIDAVPSILSRAVLKLYSEVCPEGNLCAVHIADVAEMINSGKKGELHLPCHVTVAIGENVEFFRESNKKRGAWKNKIPLFSKELEEGLNVFEDLGFILSVCGISEIHGERKEGKNPDLGNIILNNNIYNSLINISLNNDKIKGTVFVRNRRESDVYVIGGHHKKVKKLFCDKKIPVEQRDRLPIVCDDDGILWIPGFPPRDGSGAKGDCKKISIGYYIAEKESACGKLLHDE